MDPSPIPALTRLLSSWRTVVRYGLNSGVVLALKLGLMHLALEFLVPFIAYLFVHVVIFFVSYAIHSTVSFGTGLSFARMHKYFGAVILFKLLDYLLFAVVFVALDIHALWCVVAATIPVFLIRFVVVRRSLSVSMPQAES